VIVSFFKRLSRDVARCAHKKLGDIYRPFSRVKVGDATRAKKNERSMG